MQPSSHIHKEKKRWHQATEHGVRLKAQKKNKIEKTCN